MNPLDDHCRRILDNMETATLLIDGLMKLVYVNASAEALLSRSAKRLLGIPLMELVPSKGIEEAVALAIEGSAPVSRREITYTDFLDRVLTISLNVTPISEGYVLLELRPLDMFLQTSQDEARTAEYQATQKLLRGLAHEIKNPLGGIRGAAQLLALDFDDGAMCEYTDVIISETDRLRTLIDRMIGPTVPSVFKLINIHDPIEHVFRLVSAEVGGDIEFKRDYDPSIPETLLDRDQIIQSLLNLTRNAADSVGGKGKITLRTRVLRQYKLGNELYPLVIQITVEDNGPGIPPELQPEIFFPMVTSKAAGTGLGLSITQALIKAHDGLVTFQSNSEHTAFEILLPVKSLNDGK